MAQVTIYLEDKKARKIRQIAKKRGASTSKWLTNLVQKELEENWPEEIRCLAGSWLDFPSLEEIRSKCPKDIPREPF